MRHAAVNQQALNQQAAVAKQEVKAKEVPELVDPAETQMTTDNNVCHVLAKLQHPNWSYASTRSKKSSNCTHIVKLWFFSYVCVGLDCRVKFPTYLCIV